MSKELAKTYDPKGIEERLYTKWMDNGYFHAKVNPDKKPFTIVMPPPNVTGQLHMGHALDETMQDILIRFKRMQGYEALWQPGTDHAAIATEVKVIDKLKKEGIDKHDIGREEFLKHAWAWKEEYGGKIINQLKKLGASADWERERFTMDEGCSKAVQEVFIKLYEKGYIYKGSRIINWCPVCQTSISDAEVEHEDQDGFFWHINYPIVGEEGRFVEIATTRPETLLGDTAVAVNPEDERYKDLIGKMLKLPLTDREIPVIADEYVDKEFGTGCVKITPAHDPNDFEVGRRHNLEEINIMNDDATINELGGKYAGMDRYEARKAMVADLEELGYILQPHTSAGRIPSDKGYRFYVDHLMEEKDREVNEMKSFVIEHTEKMEQVLQQVAKILANNTNYATMVTAPTFHKNKVKFIQLSNMNEEQILATIVTEGNLVKNKIIPVSEPIDNETMLKLNFLLNANLNGLALQEINLGTIAKLKEQAGIHSDIISDVLDTVAETMGQDEDIRIYTSGATNFFKYPELSDSEKASELISTFEEKQQLASLVTENLLDDDNTGIQVYIGNESPIQTMKDCSVVTATYELGEGVRGTIGIVGPKRMDYEKVMDNLKTLKNSLDGILNKDKEQT